MGAQRTVACPYCGTGRVTKATGRQRLACGCGRSFLVRDAATVEPPSPSTVVDPVAGGTELAPSAADQPVPVVEPSPSQAGAIGGVQVLGPAALRLTPPTFAGNPPEVGDPVEPPAGPGREPRPGDPPASSPAPPGPSEPRVAAPVSVGPGRRLGYYGRVTGRG